MYHICMACPLFVVAVVHVHRIWSRSWRGKPPGNLETTSSGMLSRFVPCGIVRHSQAFCAVDHGTVCLYEANCAQSAFFSSCCTCCCACRSWTKSSVNWQTCNSTSESSFNFVERPFFLTQILLGDAPESNTQRNTCTCVLKLAGALYCCKSVAVDLESTC